MKRSRRIASIRKRRLRSTGKGARLRSAKKGSALPVATAVAAAYVQKIQVPRSGLPDVIKESYWTLTRMIKGVRPSASQPPLSYEQFTARATGKYAPIVLQECLQVVKPTLASIPAGTVPTVTNVIYRALARIRVPLDNGGELRFCLEDGLMVRDLTAHVSFYYNLSPADYLEKWDLLEAPTPPPKRQPQTAPSRTRSKKKSKIRRRRSSNKIIKSAPKRSEPAFWTRLLSPGDMPVDASTAVDVQTVYNELILNTAARDIKWNEVEWWRSA